MYINRRASGSGPAMAGPLFNQKQGRSHVLFITPVCVCGGGGWSEGGVGHAPRRKFRNLTFQMVHSGVYWSGEYQPDRWLRP